MDKEAVVRMYVSLRDRVSEIDEECKERTAPLREKMSLIEAALLKMMDAEGVTSVKTKAGTAYVSELKSVKIEDWNEALGFITERQAWGLLQRAVNKTVLAEDYDGEIPGVKVETYRRTNFRRK